MQRKKIMTVLILILMILPVYGLQVSAAGSATVSLKTSASSIRIGDTVTITGNFNATQMIGLFDLNITFDPSRLTYQSAAGISPAINTAKGDDLSIVRTTGKVQLLYMDGDGGLTGIKSGDAFKVVFKVTGGNTGDTVSVGVVIKTLGDSNAAGMSSTVKNATMKIAAPLSGNTSLSSLTVGNAGISPAFNKNTTQYTASVPFTIEKLNISATAEDKNSKVTINSPSLVAGGTTQASVTVKAQSGAQKTYSITVTRAQDPNYKASANGYLAGITVNPGILSPVFKKEITAYVVWLPYETANITVSGTPEDKKAKVTVAGGEKLTAGSDNPVTITCTAEDGTKRIYTITVKRAAGGPGSPVVATPSPDPVKPDSSVTSETIISKLSGAGKNGTGSLVSVDLASAGNKAMDSSVFNTLSENADAQLSLQLGGARIRFWGEKVEKSDANKKYDFSFSPVSPYEKDMIAAAGKNAVTDTYSFAYHGELPGYATFEINTDFTCGDIVNVYRYDSETKKYTLIAENIAVSAGGVVSYLNNTCSDYLITSAVIAGAEKSSSVPMQDLNGFFDTSFGMITTGFIMLVAGFILGVFGKKFLKKGKIA